MNEQAYANIIGADKLPAGARFLFALNAKANRTGSPIFAGIDRDEKARRRAKNKVARQSRRVNRGR